MMWRIMGGILGLALYELARHIINRVGATHTERTDIMERDPNQPDQPDQPQPQPEPEPAE